VRGSPIVPPIIGIVDSLVLAAVEEVAGWYHTPAKALNKCVAARQLIIDKLVPLGTQDLQMVEVSGPIGQTCPHPDVHPAHQVLRVGTEVVDVTWAQIDTEGGVAWKVYPSIDALRQDRTDVRDWATREPI
jgi:hypothetical protein